MDIWDQAYTNQGALAVMALLLVLITMSVATFAQRISNRKIKATIDDLGARETIIANLSHSPTKSYFASLKSVINQTDSPCSTAPIDGDEPNDAAVKASPPKKLVIVIDELVR